MRKQYVITDPCYLLPNDVWQKVCDECFSGKGESDYEKFNERITQELNEFAKTSNAQACDTGYGDWNNDIYSFNGDVIHGSFCADSGMVCVVEYTDNVQKALKDTPEPCYGLIETYGNVNINLDRTNSKWTVVNIIDESNVKFKSYDRDMANSFYA